MKKIILVGTKCYTMINEVLTFGEITSIVYANNDFVYLFSREEDKPTIELVSNTKFYKTEQDFVNNNWIEPRYDRFHYTSDDNGREFVAKWAMVNGEPQPVNAYISNVVITKNNGIEVNFADYKSEELFENRKSCLANNDYQVTLEDGTIQTRQGYAKLMRLTEEQNALVEQLKDTLAKLKESGVHMVYNPDSNYVGLLNSNPFKQIYFSCDCEDINLAECEDGVTWLRMDFYNKYEDCQLYYEL